MKKARSNVVIGIVEKDGSVLMIRRSQKEGDLLWCFPGGKTEKQDESEQDAVVREVLEETSIVASPVSCLGKRIHPNTGMEVSYWQCKYLSGEIKIQDPEEIAEILWVLPSRVFELVSTDIFPPIRSMLNKLLKKND